MARVKPTGWVVLVASALVIIGSLMPWATLGVFSADGTSGDGVITLIVGFVGVGGILLLGFSTWHPMLTRVVTTLGVLCALATSFYDTVHVSSEHITFLGSQISPNVGSGLWLCLIGSIVATVALIIDWRNSKQPSVVGADAAPAQA